MMQILGTAILALAVWCSLPTHAAPAAAPDEPIVLSGTVTQLDLSRLRGLLITDLGKPVFFDVPNAYLFENVTVGARITLQLDDYGRAVKVMDTALPDLLSLPASGGASLSLTLSPQGRGEGEGETPTRSPP
ncbi:hypothetical protein [Nitrospira moscoviensis]|uniref:DUF5666 domain-containing protein n=1 Tax=Nitrospira moscoviensis TaxID=42253 RepID=A0A0K2GDH4_NITMO|nr:hypothetical protein [Nitrospira moscoviensis]ALA59005.1 exported protein of unknown function [Nitrospira moscoviensis]